MRESDAAANMDWWPIDILAHDVERVLADINADHGDRSIGCLRHGVLLVFGAPCQLRLLAGQEHGRTIPLADMGRASRQ
jgi:hypothetical protein